MQKINLLTILVFTFLIELAKLFIQAAEEL
jgi:hypothetical protein